MWRVDQHYAGELATPHLDLVLSELAAAQHGVVARWQLNERGIERGAIERRLKSGHLHPVLRGVYAVGHTALGPSSRRHAAALAAGPGAVLSHRTAAAVWDLRADQRVTIDVTTAAGARSRKGTTVHRARLHPDERTTKDDLPVTSVARTLLDLATELDDRALLKVLERADRLDLLDARALARSARTNGHRGVARLDRALHAYDPRHRRTRSELERRALELLDRHGVPRPELNARVHGHEVDLAWRAERLGVELDGYETHRTRAAFERDRERDRRLATHGWHVVRLTWRQLDEDAAGAIAHLAAVLAGLAAALAGR